MIPGSVHAVINKKKVIKMRLRKKIIGSAGVTVQTVGRMKIQKGIIRPIMHT